MSAVADLLVIGAGAKAAAIAAKAHVLNELGLGPISILTVEAREPAASWLGGYGFTSGVEPLSTTPMKDVGFPYQSHELFGDLGNQIDDAMMAFSWHRYLVSTRNYARWVDAGSPAVQHRDYGEYLAWVFSRASRGARMIEGRAVQIRLDARRSEWLIGVKTAAGLAEYRSHALAMTGPGFQRVLSHDPIVADRLFHCDARRSDLVTLPAQEPVDVAIVGGGESAIACALMLRSTRPLARLTIYTPGLPMSRAESFLENRVYSSPEAVAWTTLDLRTRREFVARSDRGVFAPGGLTALASDRMCRFVTGRVRHVAATAQSAEPLLVEYAAPAGVVRARHSYLVNCTGFDVVAELRSMASAETRAEIERRVGPIWTCAPEEIAMDWSLGVANLTPALHVPAMAALSQGPGFANLSSLGLLANRVIAPVLSRRCNVLDSLFAGAMRPSNRESVQKELVGSCY